MKISHLVLPRLTRLALLAPLFTLLAPSNAYCDSEPVCVVKANTTLRKGPGLSFPVSWAVPKYMPLLKVDQKGAWFKVQDLDGEIHWVLSKAVSRKMACAVVKTKVAKLRKGPGSNQPLADLASVDKYTPFRKLDRDDDWVKVEDDFRATYWVHETNVWIPVSRTRVEF